MKIKNSTDWPDFFLRRMTSWCARQIGLPMKEIRLAVFRNSKRSWGGVARPWKRQFTTCVGGAERFPANCVTHREGDRFSDRVECLVAVTAHEVFHIAAEVPGNANFQNTRQGSNGSSENATCAEEMRVLDLFRAGRETLMAEWSSPPAYAVPKEKPSLAERRMAKALDDLARWERKRKLAITKCRKLAQKVNRLKKKNGCID